MAKKKIIVRNAFKTEIEQFLGYNCQLDDYFDETGEDIWNDEISDWIDDYMQVIDIEIVTLDDDTIKICMANDELLNNVRLLLGWIKDISYNSVYATSALRLNEPKMISSITTNQEGDLLVHLIDGR